MSKFTPKIKKPKIPSVAVVEEQVDDSASKLRQAEKRRRGRRASVLTDISENEAQLANVNRPGAGLSRLFGRG